MYATDSSPVPQGVPPWLQITLAIITLAGVITTALIAQGGRRHAREANDAVNHRHKYGVDESGEPIKPKLYDAVLDMTTSQVAIATAQAEMADAQASMAVDIDTLKRNQANIDMKVNNTTRHMFEVSKHVSELDRDLHRHVEWEEQEKYNKLEQKIDHVIQNIHSKQEEEPQ